MDNAAQHPQDQQEKIVVESTTPNIVDSSAQDSKTNIPEQDLHIWQAAARPFKRRNREFYVTIISIAAVAGLVLFLVDGWLPVMVIISLVFLFYVLSTVEPENIPYKVTTDGIRISNHLTPWHVMRRFWFTKRFENDLLVIETTIIPGRLEIVINPEDKTNLEKQMKKYIIHEEAPPTFIDKSANWFAKKLPQN